MGSNQDFIGSSFGDTRSVCSRPLMALRPQLSVRRTGWLHLAAAAALLPAAAQAGISTTGVVSPNPADAAGQQLSIGDGFGEIESSMTVDGGSDIVSQSGWIGGYSNHDTATITGQGSSWIYNDSLTIGTIGNGTLNIAKGASVIGSNGYIGDYPGTVGVVNVSGAGSNWTNSDPNSLFGRLMVGQFRGSGYLHVSAGASVNSRVSFIGADTDTNGTVTLVGPGSTWTNTDEFRIGERGHGTLGIFDGATVTANYNYGTHIAAESGSTGSVTVSGPGSSLNVGDSFIVGENGNGGLIISNYGRVNMAHGLNNGNELSIAMYAGSSGTVALQGGTLDLHSHSVVMGNGDATFDFTGGTLKNMNSFSGDLHQQGGTLIVGTEDSHYTNIVGNYTKDAAGVLQFSLGGADNGSYDHLVVNGQAVLSGWLDVVLNNGFVPDEADSFTLLFTGQSSTFSFSNVTGGTLATGLGIFDVTYNDKSVVLDHFHLAGTVQQIDAANTTAEFLGGTDTPGGVAATFNGGEHGYINIQYAAVPSSSPEPATLPPPDFSLAGEQLQYWDVAYSGDAIDPASAVTLIFTYDDTGLTLEQENVLGIYHYHNGLWELLNGLVDVNANTITIQTDSFSPFALGNVPEPGALCLLALGGLAMLRQRRRKSF